MSDQLKSYRAALAHQTRHSRPWWPALFWLGVGIVTFLVPWLLGLGWICGWW